MDAKQKAYLGVDTELDMLLVAIDRNKDKLPAEVKDAYASLGDKREYGCHADLEEGMESDECLINAGNRNDCVYANRINSPCECNSWLPISIKP